MRRTFLLGLAAAALAAPLAGQSGPPQSDT